MTNGPMTNGLRRYARAEPAAEQQSTPRCEMCGAPLDEQHRHVVALDDRALRCVCWACHLLFAPAGAGRGRLRAVPRRYLTDPAHRIAGADWDLLDIPSMPVFLFVNSDLQRVVACYPSPAGATESTLDLDSWARLTVPYPLLRMPEPDVEAIFVTRTAGGLDGFLVPIDACFSMVGTLRLHWRPPYGGETVLRALAGFADDLRSRSRPLVTEQSPYRGS
ncbi:MAG: DUF5947 family protein [Actinoplanes sp.]